MGKKAYRASKSKEKKESCSITNKKTPSRQKKVLRKQSNSLHELSAEKEQVLPSCNGLENQITQSKFIGDDQAISPQSMPHEDRYRLPFRYYDNRIVLMPRDPWWLFTYWDFSQEKIAQAVLDFGIHEKNKKWILRVYNLDDNCSFDLDINYDVGNWYVNVNQPNKTWCVEIGLLTSEGYFYAIARSNSVKTAPFGVSSQIDEEYYMPDEDYWRMLGVNLSSEDFFGDSSFQGQKKRLEDALKNQFISSFSSWMEKKKKDVVEK